MNISLEKANRIRTPLVIGATALLISLACLHVLRTRNDLLRHPTIKLVKDAPETAKIASPRVPNLRITKVVQHGHILEIRGYSEAGAIVMINGEPAATIFDGNSFRQFVGPLPQGTTVIAVTSQNEEGGVNTQQLAFTIE